MALEKPYRPVALTPPAASDNWRPGHKRQKKPFGLTVFHRWTYRVWGRPGSEDRMTHMTSWYVSERDRNSAIACENKRAEGKFYAPVAMMKVSR